MLGRRGVLANIERHLFKTTPPHLQIVGPKLYGKSVLLNHLANKYRCGLGQYCTAAYVDLRHSTPRSDDAFKARLAEEIKKALIGVNSEVASSIETSGPHVYELLGLALEELGKLHTHFLAVIDGFDHVLESDDLTKNLWDQLRALAQGDCLILVTGSRKPLGQLCQDEESRTSDFWEIFYDSPVEVSAFSDSDWSEILEPLKSHGMKLDSSGEKEIKNWAGCAPLLAIGLMHEICETTIGTSITITKAEVDQAASRFLKGRRQLLRMLWDDLDADLQKDLSLLASRGTMPLSQIPPSRSEDLEARGFAAKSGASIKSAGRLVSEFIRLQAPAEADLRRLFGRVEDYRANARLFLELRLSQIATASVDPELLECIKTAIRDIEPAPALSLRVIRNFTNRVRMLIWEAELPQDQTLPRKWLDAWSEEQLPWVSKCQGRLPSWDSAQLHVLRLLTGAKNIPSLAKSVTKPTYLLLNHLHPIGDIALHLEDYPNIKVTTEFAASILLSAIELLQSLSDDLRRPAQQGKSF